MDPLNAAPLPVGPVDVITQQREAKDVVELVFKQSLSVTAVHIDHLKRKGKKVENKNRKMY